MEANATLTLWTAGIITLGFVYWFLCLMGSAEVKGKRVLDLKAGSITHNEVHNKYSQYWSFFRQPKELSSSSAIASKVPSIISTYYDLITDITEWGWGQSIHFSPAVKGCSHREATRLHEERVANLIKARPGEKIVDVGCGIGGPMRAIASYSGARIVGITINQYQVTRAQFHNKKAGLSSQCEVVCGNFMEMPFEDASFDKAYSIEASSHAPRLEDVYTEVFRVLKPGGLFVAYEWVTTPLYRGDDKQHVEIIHGIERGGALPGLRAQHEIGGIARKVGFEVVAEEDLAVAPAGPWWDRLKMGRVASWRNHVLLYVLSTLRIAPKGIVEVHAMLDETAIYLTRAGETGIFSPMYMVLCRKPVA